MAHLLGNRFCIESLRSDVTDLQGAVVDVFSRVGPVRLPSWKYPDKVSCDVDIMELLDVHDHGDDEEDNQVAHIVLLELVVDRLVLLLQAMSKYTDQTMVSGRGTSAVPAKSSTSIGLVVKKYWNKMVQLGSHVHQITTENKNKSRAIQDLEGTMAKLLDIDQKPEGSGGSVRVTIPLNELDASRLKGGSAASNLSISRDECIKSTQTIETAFVPCESCDIVQKNLRDVGDTVVTICGTQDLPSSLSKHRTQIGKLSWMSGTDVARWAAEQNKDLARINKHLSSLHGTIEPLKQDLEKEQKTNKVLHSRMAECAKEVVLERETQSVQQKQYQTKLQDLQQQSQEEVSRVHRTNVTLQKGKSQLEQQVKEMKADLKNQQECIRQLEVAREQIVVEMEQKMTDNEHVHRLEDQIEQQCTHLEEVQEKLRTTSRELSKEQARNKSINKQTESLQGKQSSLLERVDSLDQENEDLRGQLCDLEEQEGKLQTSIDFLKDQLRQVQAQFREQKAFVKTLTQERDLIKAEASELRDNISTIEQRLEEALEQQRLIVEYPDLNGPVNPDLVGTGDLATDMENQVKANSVRISLLEDQNIKLRNTITKVLQAHSKVPSQASSKPVPLWNIGEKIDDHTENSSHHETTASKPQRAPPENCDPTAPTRHWDSAAPQRTQSKSSVSKNGAPAVRESFVVAKGPNSAGARPQSRSKGSVARAAKLVNAPGNNSSIGTFLQLKKSGMLKTEAKAGPGRPTSGKVAAPSEASYYVPEETFSCHKCDKMYNSSRDLDIHRSYCYGGT